MLDQTKETERLLALRDLAILDTVPEREFDALATIAKTMFGTEVALLTLIDHDRQWFKARCGLDLSETPRGLSFCTIAVETEAPLVVEDTLLDERFETNPFVTGDPHIRFYAGVPVRVRKSDGSGTVAIGSICVIDSKTRKFSSADVKALTELACVAEALFEARATARLSVELADTRQKLLDRLQRERRQFKQAELMANMGSWRWTTADNSVEWSEGVFAIHELPVRALPPLETLLDFYPEADRTKIAHALANTQATGDAYDFESDFITAKGNLRRVRSMGEVELSNGVAVAIIGAFQDITERHRMEQALLRVARTDELTRLPNRAEFNRVLDEKLLVADSTGDEVALLLIDLDNFKTVNDKLGHAAGDDILRNVGKCLKAKWLSGAFAARLGGDEFVIIVPSQDNRDAVKEIVNRLLSDLQLSAEEAGVKVRISATIGIAWSQGMSLPRAELLKRADAALYAAKRTQKGTAQTFTQPLLIQG